MTVIGLDPGYEQSALVFWDGEKVGEHGIFPNLDVIERLRESPSSPQVLAIEGISAMGMAVGKEVFETVYISGIFAASWYPNRVERVFRHDVKLHICGQRRAKDGEIRQAIIDRFGPTKEKAIGKKKTPGPLFGIASHEWAALAVALTFHDLHSGEIRPGVTPHF